MLNWDDYNESEKTQKPQLQKEQTKSMESEQTLSVQEEGPAVSYTHLTLPTKQPV